MMIKCAQIIVVLGIMLAQARAEAGNPLINGNCFVLETYTNDKGEVLKPIARERSFNLEPDPKSEGRFRYSTIFPLEHYKNGFYAVATFDFVRSPASWTPDNLSTYQFIARVRIQRQNGKNVEVLGTDADSSDTKIIGAYYWASAWAKVENPKMRELYLNYHGDPNVPETGGLIIREEKAYKYIEAARNQLIIVEFNCSINTPKT